MSPVKVPAIGVTDGANTLFRTPHDYRPGTLVAFRNGQAIPSQTTELGGRDFELEIAPKTDDKIVAYYARI